jgi:hypothetical protein
VALFKKEFALLRMHQNRAVRAEKSCPLPKTYNIGIFRDFVGQARVLSTTRENGFIIVLSRRNGRGEDFVGAIIIACPVTGRPVNTGISMPKVAFDNSSLENNSVGPCPHCGQTHVWSKKNAVVSDD